jgi:hypothetical protein
VGGTLPRRASGPEGRINSRANLTCESNSLIRYEHTPPRINLTPLLAAFEVVARDVIGIRLSSRVQTKRVDLVHPVHQQLWVAGWQVLSRAI